MASIYTAPSTSFIDSYINAAKYLDERGDERTKQIFQGAENLVRGGADAYKWQVRKNIADEQEQLMQQLNALKAERDMLMAGGDTPNFDSIMSGYNPALDTGRLL